MKNIVKVTGLIALAGATFFAVNAGSALAAPPPPFGEHIIPHIPFDPPLDPGPGLHPLCQDGDICHDLQPIDPCILTGTCGADDPTAAPTDDPTATPTDEPTTQPTDIPPTQVPATQPTDIPPTQVPATAQPQPGNLPYAGDNGGIINDVGGGVVLLAGVSLGAMALAWVMLLASRKTQTRR